LGVGGGERGGVAPEGVDVEGVGEPSVGDGDVGGGGAGCGEVEVGDGESLGVVVEGDGEGEVAGVGASPGELEGVVGEGGAEVERTGEWAARDEDAEGVDGGVGGEGVVVNLLDDVGALGERGVVASVAGLVDLAERADEGGGEGEAGAVVLLRGSARVGDVVGTSARAELPADFVLDDSTELSGEVDFHSAACDAHRSWNVLMC